MIPGITRNVGIGASDRWVRTLRRFVDPPDETCELCRVALPETHEHLLGISSRRLVCACAACAERLFENHLPGLRPIITQKRKLPDFSIADEQWLSFEIPVEVAFFIREERTGIPIAFYPGPLGLAQSELTLESWHELVAQHHWLTDLAAETEALLVNRRSKPPEYYLLSADYCYALAGTMRKEWRGVSGGARLWDAIDGFFVGLSGGAEPRHV